MSGLNRKTAALALAFTLLGMAVGFGAGWINAGDNVAVLEENAVEQNAAVETASPKQAEAPPPVPDKAREAFDPNRAMKVIELLTVEIGVRVEGSAQERRAAEALKKTLNDYGLTNVTLQPYYLLTTNELSYNVVARVEGKNPDYVLVVGGHYDSRDNTVGANDNASGAACTVELARVIKANGGVCPTVVFICFGGEEDPGGETSHVNCHFGSRHYVDSMDPLEKQRMVGMISLDVVGYGDQLYARFMNIGPMLLVQMITQFGNANGYNLAQKAGGNLSDHEPFEKAGIPSVWLEFMVGGDYDKAVHTSADNYNHINPQNLAHTGELMQSFLESLDEAACLNLKASRNK